MTGDIYQVEMTTDFKPYRLAVKFVKGHATSIKPLIQGLSFIKKRPGGVLHFALGTFKSRPMISKIIAEAMGAND